MKKDPNNEWDVPTKDRIELKLLMGRGLKSLNIKAGFTCWFPCLALPHEVNTFT